jgi:hypothetical protein
MYSHNAHRRDYGAAVAALNTLQSNFSVIEAFKKLGPGRNHEALPEMREWIRRIGCEVCVRSLYATGLEVLICDSRPISTS